MKNIDLLVNVIILSNAEIPEEDLNCPVCEKTIMEQDGDSDNVGGNVVFCEVLDQLRSYTLLWVSHFCVHIA